MENVICAGCGVGMKAQDELLAGPFYLCGGCWVKEESMDIFAEDAEVFMEIGDTEHYLNLTKFYA